MKQKWSWEKHRIETLKDRIIRCKELMKCRLREYNKWKKELKELEEMELKK